MIELAEPVDMPTVTAAAVAAGVWLRPFRNLIYAMPPYVCTAEEIDRIAAGMVAAASSQSRSRAESDLRRYGRVWTATASVGAVGALGGGIRVVRWAVERGRRGPIQAHLNAVQVSLYGAAGGYR
ncbi:hypothetical protein GS416_12180 [Rhodococcus hoagii]|nr:hypothetical protein [Prescottella equi]